MRIAEYQYVLLNLYMLIANCIMFSVCHNVCDVYPSIVPPSIALNALMLLCSMIDNPLFMLVEHMHTYVSVSPPHCLPSTA